MTRMTHRIIVTAVAGEITMRSRYWAQEEHQTTDSDGFVKDSQRFANDRLEQWHKHSPEGWDRITITVERIA